MKSLVTSRQYLPYLPEDEFGEKEGERNQKEDGRGAAFYNEAYGLRASALQPDQEIRSG